jgi:hypothetical protein
MEKGRHRVIIYAYRLTISSAEFWGFRTPISQYFGFGWLVQKLAKLS